MHKLIVTKWLNLNIPTLNDSVFNGDGVTEGSRYWTRDLDIVGLNSVCHPSLFSLTYKLHHSPCGELSVQSFES